MTLLRFRQMICLVTVTGFLFQCVCAHAVEASFWEQRRKSVQQMKQGTRAPVYAQSKHGLSSAQYDMLAHLPAPSQMGLHLSQHTGLVSAPPSSSAPNTPLPFKLTTSSGQSPSWMSSVILPYGSIREIHLAKNPDAPIIVHIQDAHGIEEAQKNISAMIQGLREKQSVDLVGLESASGAFDLKSFRHWPDSAVVREVAEFFLKQGKIGGPEFAGITTPEPPVLYGVENQDLYVANVKALKESITAKPAMTKTLADLKKRTSALKDTVYSQSLKDFDRQLRDYQKQKLGLSAYVRCLFDNMPAQTSASFSNLHLLMKALHAEDSLDFKKVEKERFQLVETLAGRLSKQQLNLLVQRSFDYRSHQMSYGDYHRFLRRLCRKNKISLKSLTQFNNYIEYILLAEQIDRSRLLEELSLAEQEVLDSLCVTPEQKQLADMSRHVILLEKLATHTMTPDDWAGYQEKRSVILEIHTGLASLGSEQEQTHNASALSLTVKPFEDFCRYAIDRNTAFVGNLLTQMKTQNARSAVLVAGGFHSEGLARIFRKKDLSYAVVTPKITEIPENNHYLDVFARDPLPLEKLFAGETIFLNIPRLTASHAVPGFGSQAKAFARDFIATMASACSIIQSTLSLEEIQATANQNIGALKSPFPIHITRTHDGTRTSVDTDKDGRADIAIHAVPEQIPGRVSSGKIETRVFSFGQLLYGPAIRTWGQKANQAIQKTFKLLFKTREKGTSATVEEIIHLPTQEQWFFAAPAVVGAMGFVFSGLFMAIGLGGLTMALLWPVFRSAHRQRIQFASSHFQMSSLQYTLYLLSRYVLFGMCGLVFVLAGGLVSAGSPAGFDTLVLSQWSLLGQVIVWLLHVINNLIFIPAAGDRSLPRTSKGFWFTYFSGWGETKLCVTKRFIADVKKNKGAVFRNLVEQTLHAIRDKQPNTPVTIRDDRYELTFYYYGSDTDLRIVLFSFGLQSDVLYENKDSLLTEDPWLFAPDDEDLEALSTALQTEEEKKEQKSWASFFFEDQPEKQRSLKELIKELSGKETLAEADDFILSVVKTHNPAWDLHQRLANFAGHLPDHGHSYMKLKTRIGRQGMPFRWLTLEDLRTMDAVLTPWHEHWQYIQSDKIWEWVQAEFMKGTPPNFSAIASVRHFLNIPGFQEAIQQNFSAWLIRSVVDHESKQIKNLAFATKAIEGFDVLSGPHMPKGIQQSFDSRTVSLIKNIDKQIKEIEFDMRMKSAFQSKSLDPIRLRNLITTFPEEEDRITDAIVDWMNTIIIGPGDRDKASQAIDVLQKLPDLVPDNEAHLGNLVTKLRSISAPRAKVAKKIKRSRRADIDLVILQSEAEKLTKVIAPMIPYLSKPFPTTENVQDILDLVDGIDLVVNKFIDDWEQGSPEQQLLAKTIDAYLKSESLFFTKNFLRIMIKMSLTPLRLNVLGIYLNTLKTRIDFLSNISQHVSNGNAPLDQNQLLAMDKSRPFSWIAHLGVGIMMIFSALMLDGWLELLAVVSGSLTFAQGFGGLVLDFKKPDAPVTAGFQDYPPYWADQEAWQAVVEWKNTISPAAISLRPTSKPGRLMETAKGQIVVSPWLLAKSYSPAFNFIRTLILPLLLRWESLRYSLFHMGISSFGQILLSPVLYAAQIFLVFTYGLKWITDTIKKSKGLFAAQPISPGERGFTPPILMAQNGFNGGGKRNGKRIRKSHSAAKANPPWQFELPESNGWRVEVSEQVLNAFLGPNKQNATYIQSLHMISKHLKEGYPNVDFSKTFSHYGRTMSELYSTRRGKTRLLFAVDKDREVVQLLWFGFKKSIISSQGKKKHKVDRQKIKSFAQQGLTPSRNAEKVRQFSLLLAAEPEKDSQVNLNGGVLSKDLLLNDAVMTGMTTMMGGMGRSKGIQELHDFLMKNDRIFVSDKDTGEVNAIIPFLELLQEFLSGWEEAADIDDWVTVLELELSEDEKRQIYIYLTQWKDTWESLYTDLKEIIQNQKDLTESDAMALAGVYYQHDYLGLENAIQETFETWASDSMDLGESDDYEWLKMGQEEIRKIYAVLQNAPNGEEPFHSALAEGFIGQDISEPVRDGLPASAEDGQVDPESLLTDTDSALAQPLLIPQLSDFTPDEQTLINDAALYMIDELQKHGKFPTQTKIGERVGVAQTKVSKVYFTVILAVALDKAEPPDIKEIINERLLNKLTQPKKRRSSKKKEFQEEEQPREELTAPGGTEDPSAAPQEESLLSPPKSEPKKPPFEELLQQLKKLDDAQKERLSKEAGIKLLTIHGVLLAPESLDKSLAVRLKAGINAMDPSRLQARAFAQASKEVADTLVLFADQLLLFDNPEHQLIMAKALLAGIKRLTPERPDSHSKEKQAVYSMIDKYIAEPLSSAVQILGEGKTYSFTMILGRINALNQMPLLNRDLLLDKNGIPDLPAIVNKKTLDRGASVVSEQTSPWFYAHAADIETRIFLGGLGLLSFLGVSFASDILPFAGVILWMAHAIEPFLTTWKNTQEMAWPKRLFSVCGMAIKRLLNWEVVFIGLTTTFIGLLPLVHTTEVVLFAVAVEALARIHKSINKALSAKSTQEDQPVKTPEQSLRKMVKYAMETGDLTELVGEIPSGKVSWESLRPTLINGSIWDAPSQRKDVFKRLESNPQIASRLNQLRSYANSLNNPDLIDISLFNQSVASAYQGMGFLSNTQTGTGHFLNLADYFKPGENNPFREHWELLLSMTEERVKAEALKPGQILISTGAESLEFENQKQALLKKFPKLQGARFVQTSIGERGLKLLPVVQEAKENGLTSLDVVTFEGEGATLLDTENVDHDYVHILRLNISAVMDKALKLMSYALTFA